MSRKSAGRYKNENRKFSNDDMVDISSGKSVYTNKSKKKIIIISSVSAVVVALAATGVCLWQSGTINNVISNITETTTPPPFTFEDDTYVSGISISGKTYAQAKMLLQSRQKDFVPSFEINVVANDDTTKVTQEDLSYTYNFDEILTEIKNDELNSDGNSKETTTPTQYTITATHTKKSLENVVDSIKKKTNKDPKNAEVSKFTPYSSKNRFTFAEAKTGYKLDTDDLTSQMENVLSNNTKTSQINAKVEKTDAKITKDMVEDNIELLCTYQTTSYNTSNGNTNMTVSLGACNGSVIEPGAKWSFNECTGDSNLTSNGYKSAHVISEGKLIDGVGGGICQSSSTIYNAAVRANMKVEERYNHLWPSSYVPTGLDATIDYPNLDLKLSNPTDYQMFIECKMDGTTLTCTIWGYKDSKYDKIKTTNELTSDNSESITVKAWRVYYKDGKKVDKESLGSSTYQKQNGYAAFINADNDSGDVTNYSKTIKAGSVSDDKTDDKEDTEETTKANEEQETQAATEKETQKATQKATEKPTQKATTPKETEPVETKVPATTTHQE